MSTRTLVCFTTRSGRCAVGVEQVLEVRPAVDLQPVARAREGVVGLLHGRDDGTVVTVVEAFGPGGEHVLVLESASGPFGLHVGEVTGLVRVDPATFGPPPSGQRDDAVTGVVRLAGDLVLLVDAARLAAVLWPDGRTSPERVLKPGPVGSKEEG